MSDVNTAFLSFFWQHLDLFGAWLGNEPETTIFLSIGIDFYIGSSIILDNLTGKKNPYSGIFSFER